MKFFGQSKNTLICQHTDKEKLLEIIFGEISQQRDEIGLKEHLSPTRANGLVSMIKQMKMYALAYQTQLKN